MKVPRLELRTAGDTAFCGRCGSVVGVLNHVSPVNGMVSYGNVALEHARGMGWVEIARDGERSEYQLLRRRHGSPLAGAPVNGLAAFALPGDIVHCPIDRCAARQRVPQLR